MNLPTVMRLLRHPVARNTGWMTAGFATRTILQLAAFVMVARALGPEGFGAFAGVVALAMILAPFVELGGYSLIVRDVAAGVPTAQVMGNSLLVCLVTLLPSLALLAGLKLGLLPQASWVLILACGLAEGLGGRLYWLGCASHVAHGLLKRNAILEIIGSVLRLGLAWVLLRVNGTVELWAGLYLGQALVMGGLAQGSAWQLWGHPKGTFRGLWNRMREGWHFAVGQAAQIAHLDLDKALLPRLATLEATGIYTAAYRFVAVAYLPLNAFESATYSRFFEAGQRGLAEARRFAWQAMCVTGAYGLAVAAGLWLVAPWLLRLSLGQHFAGSVAALRWLVVLPLLQSLYLPLADALTGSGRQVWRTGGQVGALLISVGLNFWLIPQGGWHGAVGAVIVSHAAFGFFVLYRSHQE